MTSRGVRTADAAKDRRRASGQRVHFEAMVAVGEAEGGAAFEAESVDVSSQGMRLRTAYLPQIGDRLVCRFDGPGTEVVAIGEVLWATEQARGGEFGLKFVDLDEETETALKELCAEESEGAPAEAEPAAPAKPKIASNARVKLHIEGLASPMKARVRDGSDKDVCVGSSLEFLKLGRQVEVEDVDAGDRREGFVDAVKVEVDPSTSIPQLVVSLRFDAVAVGKGVAIAKSADPEIEAEPPTKIAGTPASKRVAADTEQTAASRPSKPPKKPAADADKPASREIVAAEPADDDEGLGAPNKLRAAQDKAKDLTAKAAASIAPAFSKMGTSAKSFFSSIKGTLDKRREARAEAKKANAPRRVTAPPPGGALTSEGRRVVRQDLGNAEEVEEAPAPVSKRSKKGIVVGAAAGLALVLGVVGVSKALGGKTEEPGAAVVASADAKKSVAQGIPPIPGAPATADIPLYGPTPLSTTEQVIPPIPSAQAKKGEAADDGAGGDEGEEGGKSDLVTEWGNGEVNNAKPFLVKMDGPIEGFSGSEIENGFSIVVPKHESVSSSSAIVRKDKRLAAVDVENREGVAEIRMKFKGEVPAYKVKVRGDKLEIRLSGSSGGSKGDKSDTKKVASKKGKGDKKASSEKKSSKKPADKKAH
ncbi:MAG: hypothetical protein HOW73_06235 [Polyangiaceae bacterium]|nr:hypothetical protein [Polyangiaceae bacterium]